MARIRPEQLVAFRGLHIIRSSFSSSGQAAVMRHCKSDSNPPPCKKDSTKVVLSVRKDVDNESHTPEGYKMGRDHMVKLHFLRSRFDRH